ncbi:MAG: flagellar assembly protein FliW [bacterium]
MKIKNEQFGEFEFSEDLLISFNEGLLGFEEFKKYLLITEENGIFYWLTSVDEPEIVFPLFPIRSLQDNFPMEKEMEPFGIVRLDKNPGDITINLKAPVYLDQNTKTGMQKIIDSDEYPVSYKLFIQN